MNLYVIVRKCFEENPDTLYWFDEYTGAVVCAEDEESARKIHPSGHNEYWGKDVMNEGWVETYNEVSVKLIGIADAKYKEECVIFQSYLHG